MEFDPASGTNVFRVYGHCPICEAPSEFVATRDELLETHWLPIYFRDHLICINCGSIPRERALFAVLSRFYPNWRDLAIHESSPGARGASVKLRQECPRYIHTQYDPALASGNIHPVHGYRSEDLEAQTFADESFDLVVTQDVFEHLFDPAQALREIGRTLKPGGAHIFTVPIVNGSKPSVRRARLTNGTVEHLAEPHYHGNPMSAEGSLVVIDWGYDMIPYLALRSGLPIVVVEIDDISRGIRAVYIDVLVAQKPGAMPQI
jgi:hypothetical protein